MDDAPDLEIPAALRRTAQPNEESWVDSARFLLDLLAQAS